MIKVFIIDDHKILLESIVTYLKSKAHIICVGSALTGKEGVEKLSIIKTDIVLMDIGLPDMSGLDCTELLMKNNPELKIIGLSGYLEISVVKKMFKLGAKGYVSKNCGMEELFDAIQQVYNGKNYVSPSVQSAFLNELSGNLTSKYTLLPQITKRELEVLNLIKDEYTTSQISEKLFISVNTVESHRKNLISKFQVKNAVGLIIKALELNIIKL